MVRISSVETRTYRYPLDPPFVAAWDPVPRAVQEATLVVVHSDEGEVGYASGGDGLPDAALLDRLLRGVDPEDAAHVYGICETVDFHGGRPWAVEIACWDLVGRALGEPLWKLLGGRRERLTAYASTGELLAPAERAERAVQLTGGGVKAIKLRFHHDDWRTDMATVAAVRDAVGAEVELMVDANQGWRMPGDLTPRWDVETAAACASALEEYDVPLARGAAAHRRSRGVPGAGRADGIRLAAGEMVRTAARPTTWWSTARSTCCSATCCSAAGSPAPAGWRRWPRSAAPPGRRTRGRTATGWSRTCTRPAHSPPTTTSRCRSIHLRGRPSGGTGCCPRRSRSPRTAPSRHRTAPAWASSPTWMPWNGGESA